MKKKLSNRITIQTDTCFQDQISIAHAALAFIERLTNIDKETLEDVKTTICEAVSNSMLYAYPNKSGKISVCISIFDNNTLEIKVRDWGCGIDNIEKARSPLFSTSKNGERAGLGFSVMESFSEKLIVKSTPGKGTIVTMKFKLK